MGQYQRQSMEIIKGNKYFIIATSRPFKAQEQIIDHLEQKRGLTEVDSVDECDVILVFCPIVSRAGTDIDAALNKLDNACSERVSRPVIFMVLHSTFDHDKIVPDSSRFMNRMNTLTVDFLFSEDDGLLNCSINDEALNKMVCRFKKEDTFVVIRKHATSIAFCIAISVLCFSLVNKRSLIRSKLCGLVSNFRLFG